MDSALTLGLKLAAAMDALEIPYALGGALAYNTAGVPRGTNDVDINVFLRPDQLDPVFDVLERLGATLDRQRERREAELQGMVVARIAGMRVDVFVPSIDFSWEAQRTRRRLRSDEGEAWYLSPEALAVFKLLFFRGKDIVDLERLVATQRANLDHAYIRKHIVEMMGEDDPRTQTWDRLVREFASP
jgi:hypothetical protein